jgi:hypothetical protein
MIKKTAAWFKLYQKIYIAVFTSFTAGHRTEQAHIMRPVQSGHTEDFGSFFTHNFLRIHGHQENSIAGRTDYFRWLTKPGLGGSATQAAAANRLRNTVSLLEIVEVQPKECAKIRTSPMAAAIPHPHAGIWCNAGRTQEGQHLQARKLLTFEIWVTPRRQVMFVFYAWVP